MNKKKLIKRCKSGDVVENNNSPYTQEQQNKFLLDAGISMIPIVGTLQDAYNLYKEPSWENLGWLGVSLLAEVPFFKWMKAGKIAKASKAAKAATEAAEKLAKAEKTVEKLKGIKNINPKRLESAINRKGVAFYNNKVAQRQLQDAGNAAEYFRLPYALGMSAETPFAAWQSANDNLPNWQENIK